MTKFRHLPAAGRAIIIVVAIGVLAIAVVACATSYNAIYRLVGQLGLYGYRINQGFPLLLDAAFLVAELAAILAGIMRAVTHSDEVSAGWPGAAMLLCGLGTIGFNVGHAYLLGGRGDPLTLWRCVVASLPPVLMMVSFQVLIAIVKWVMLHLGRPLNSAAALTPTAPVPGYGLVPPAGPYGLFPPHPVYGQVPSVGQQGAGHNGHGELPEPTKRAAVEMYLSRLAPQEVGVATGSSVVAALAGQGIAVEETYAGRILGEWRVNHPAPATPGERAADDAGRAAATLAGKRPLLAVASTTGTRRLEVIYVEYHDGPEQTEVGRIDWQPGWYAVCDECGWMAGPCLTEADAHAAADAHDLAMGRQRWPSWSASGRPASGCRWPGRSVMAAGPTAGGSPWEVLGRPREEHGPFPSEQTMVAAKVAHMRQLEAPPTERPAAPGERCTCGRQAVVVYLGSVFGPTGYCGIADGGDQSGPCPFCGGPRHQEGRCPDYRLRLDQL